MNRKLRMGMVGGGPGAFIGEVHRKAARMDGGIRLVAGAFSSDPEKSKQTGCEQRLDPSRAYGSYSEMIERESKLPADERMDFVSIVTPNHLHFPIARDCLRAGFHVVCDKPMTLNVREALELRDLVKKSKKVFALTHNYTGYPMVKQARWMCRKGLLGAINKVVAQFPQGWQVRKRQQIAGHGFGLQIGIPGGPVGFLVMLGKRDRVIRQPQAAHRLDQRLDSLVGLARLETIQGQEIFGKGIVGRRLAKGVQSPPAFLGRCVRGE